jgi:hypothetical protein
MERGKRDSTSPSTANAKPRRKSRERERERGKRKSKSKSKSPERTAEQMLLESPSVLGLLHALDAIQAKPEQRKKQEQVNPPSDLQAKATAVEDVSAVVDDNIDIDIDIGIDNMNTGTGVDDETYREGEEKQNYKEVNEIVNDSNKLTGQQETFEVSRSTLSAKSGAVISSSSSNTSGSKLNPLSLDVHIPIEFLQVLDVGFAADSCY